MAKEKPIVFVRRASGLVRELGSIDIMAAVMATVIGAGVLYFAVKAPVGFPGASIPLAYLIAACLEIPFVACIGLMVSSLPRSGGLYVPISRVLHPTVGFVGGWCFVVCLGFVIGVMSFVAMITLGTGLIIAGLSIPSLTSAGEALCSHLEPTSSSVMRRRLACNHEWDVSKSVLKQNFVLFLAKIHPYKFGEEHNK
jgi:amino acid transporter